MRRVILLVSLAVVLGTTGCAKYYGRRYAPAYYAGDSCGCDGAIAPVGGAFLPGPSLVSPQALAPMPAPVSKTISSTPIQGPAF
jgi:hypothetical protein